MAVSVQRAVPVFLLALAASLLLAAGAQGYVYWGGFGSDSIGRSLLDGGGIEASFIGAPNPPVNPCGVALDAEHVYWANQAGSPGLSSISRARLDGSELESDFITGASNPCGVAVSPAWVYWANTGSGSIGRAAFDGSGVDQEFISGLGSPQGIAVDATYLYWTDTGESVFRQPLAGGVPEPFIAGTFGALRDVAVDAAHVYWADANERIGRANLDGSGVETSFIALSKSAYSVAVDDSHVYWAEKFADRIGRANLDGSGVEEGFVSDLDEPSGLAVDQLPPPPGGEPGPPAVACTAGAKIVRVARNRRRGTAKLVVRVTEAGTVRLSGSGKLRGVQRRAKAPGKVVLPVRPKRATAKRLHKAKRLKVGTRVIYFPTCGRSQVKKRKLALLAPKKRHR